MNYPPSKNGRALARICMIAYSRILSAPVIHSASVPGLMSAQWPPAIVESKPGFVYFATTKDKVMKIGFSRAPMQRVITLKATAELFIFGCELLHEKTMHSIFRDHQVGPELYRGELIRGFISRASCASIGSLEGLDKASLAMSHYSKLVDAAYLLHGATQS